MGYEIRKWLKKRFRRLILAEGSGGAGRNRTAVYRFCRPMHYHFATAPYRSPYGAAPYAVLISNDGFRSGPRLELKLINAGLKLGYRMKCRPNLPL